MTEDAAPLWTPSPQLESNCNLTRFVAHLHTTRGLTFSAYADLWNWSVTDLEGFWGAIWEYSGLDATGFDRVLGNDSMPGAQWFPGATVNFAEQLLAAGHPDAVAIISVDEAGETRIHTRTELRQQTAALARSFADAGIGAGDVVAGYVPNSAESVIAMLATATIGAVWSSVGLDYAPQAVIDRFAQLQPKVLIAADGYTFGGRLHDRTDAIEQIQRALSTTLETTVVIPRVATAALPTTTRSWAEVISTGQMEAHAVDFSHPLWVLFSSGTTGIPKGLIHSHGGILIETLKQMGLHWNLTDSDRVFWYTSPSWVMWNLQLSTLLIGGSIVCYDGSPTYPNPAALWSVVEQQQVTFFGTSPGYLQMSAKTGIEPAAQFDLSHLKALSSTGSPLPTETHRWAIEHVGDLPLWSISGGTDIAGAFCGGAPIVPIWPGELSCRCLGVAADAWNERGEPVRNEVGELVITRPMPSMPIELWNDPSGEKYRDAYFSMFDHAWRQGDWITVTDRDSVVIHGRSDSTLNRNGVRMGSGEIYAAVEAFPEVTDSLIIGVEETGGRYWMPLFIVLASGKSLSDALTADLKAAISRKVSPRHIPDDIIAVAGVPHTRTGKKLEVPIKRLFQGAEMAKVVNPDAVDNAEHLRNFVELARRRAVSTARKADHVSGFVLPNNAL